MEIDLNFVGIRMLDQQDIKSLLNDLRESDAPYVTVLGDYEDYECSYSGIVENDQRVKGGIWVEHDRMLLVEALEELL